MKTPLAKLVRQGLLFLLISTEAFAQDVPDITISAAAEILVPLGDDSGIFSSLPVGGSLEARYSPFTFFSVLARTSALSFPLSGGGALLYAGGAGGMGFNARFFDWLDASANFTAGLGRATFNDTDYGLYELTARIGFGFRISPSVAVSVSGGYERLAAPDAPFIDAIHAGVSVSMATDELGTARAKLALEKVETDSVFPVFRSWYDTNPFGQVTVRNGEDGPIDEIRISFFAPEYMGGPRVLKTIPRLARGESATVDLYALFDERALTLTENTKTQADISVEYSFIGGKRTVTQSHTLSLHHRNAMNWEDDRRAAAFVSSTDPSVLWFSRYSTGIARDRLRTGLPPNLQYALCIFESLKLYGINYVIDPNSSYSEISEKESVVDFLQYPNQTLFYRGGDCDDLSILYCSLLESSGIATAFITIPGHIYMAFDLEMAEADARERFFDPGLLVFRDGSAWVPVEITMVKDGFVKAWRVGAKEWLDGDRNKTAAFYPMRENWTSYKPMRIPDAMARFSLPDEATTMTAFDTAVDRFLMREVEPMVEEFERRLAHKRDPETLNEYGMALAGAGLLDPAWKLFAEATEIGFPWAWNNLATVAFVRKDYELAYSYYRYALELLPDDSVSVLGLARSSYELDRFRESTALYLNLEKTAPALAETCGYLLSVYGGSGRAWSMADRLSGSVWSKPGLSFDRHRETTKTPEAETEIGTKAFVTDPPPAVIAKAETEKPAETEPDSPAPRVVREAPRDADIAIIGADASNPPSPQTPTRIMPPALVTEAPKDADIRAKREEKTAIPPEPPPGATPSFAPEPERETPPGTEPVPPTAEPTHPTAERIPSLAESTETPAAATRESPLPENQPEPVRGNRESNRDVLPVPETVQDEPILVDLSDRRNRALAGAWSNTKNRAVQGNQNSYSAKLVIPAAVSGGTTVYEFTAFSSGRGWVGFGMHVMGRGSWNMDNYGGGDSLLVWITTDPKHYGDDRTRLELYISRDDIDMHVIESVVVPESAFEEHRYRIECDSVSRVVTVSIDGVTRLTGNDISREIPSSYVALRALDKASFRNVGISRPNRETPIEPTEKTK